MKGLFKYMSIKRLLHIFFLKVANMSLLCGEYRWKFVKLGGVNVEGKCWIYKDVHFDSVAPELITIGYNATITRGTTILTHYFDPSQPGRHFLYGEVKIEKDAFVGCNVIICNSVTIGEGSIVGAGSIVTKDIPPYQVWAGNPARYIKDRAR